MCYITCTVTSRHYWDTWVVGRESPETSWFDSVWDLMIVDSTWWIKTFVCMIHCFSLRLELTAQYLGMSTGFQMISFSASSLNHLRKNPPECRVWLLLINTQQTSYPTPTLIEPHVWDIYSNGVEWEGSFTFQINHNIVPGVYGALTGTVS